jgi:hypothetical protein
MSFEQGAPVALPAPGLQVHHNDRSSCGVSGSHREHNDSSDSISGPPSEKIRQNSTPRALLDDAQLVTAHGNIVTKDGVVVSTQDSDSSLSTNIFADPEVKAYCKFHPLIIHVIN